MFTTVILFVSLVFISLINGATSDSSSDSLTIMREKCAQNPYADECTRIKQQMEDLLRKCRDMATPVSACSDVKNKYCFIWPKELYCYTTIGGGSETTRSPWGTDDPNWYLIPSDPNELKSRGDYCVAHQTEPKCRNLLNALKVRYDECSKRPRTDIVCQNFKISLCAAFPKFSPCLNGSGYKRQVTQLERMTRKRRKLQHHNT